MTTSPARYGARQRLAGERWLDIRRTAVLRPLMARRMDMCRDKGFDAVEPDLMDGYLNRTGFPLTARHQLAYNRMLAELAHERGLAVGLKNDLPQIPELVGSFDFAVNEECAEFGECAALTPSSSRTRRSSTPSTRWTRTTTAPRAGGCG